MTRRKNAVELVQGAMRNLQTMKQYADKDAAELELMALRRVYEQLSADVLDDIPTLTPWNVYAVDRGQPLLGRSLIADDADAALPSLVHEPDEAVSGVSDDPGTLPARTYDVRLHKVNGKPVGIYVALDWTAT